MEVGKSRGLSLTGTAELLQQLPSLDPGVAQMHKPASVSISVARRCGVFTGKLVLGIHRRHVSSTGELLGFSELWLLWTGPPEFR